MDTEGVSPQYPDEIEGSLDEATAELRASPPPPTGAPKGWIVGDARTIHRGFGTRTGLKIALKSCGVVDQLSLQRQQTLIRIVQEALTNVYRWRPRCALRQFQMCGQEAAFGHQR